MNRSQTTQAYVEGQMQAAATARGQQEADRARQRSVREARTELQQNIRLEQRQAQESFRESRRRQMEERRTHRQQISDYKQLAGLQVGAQKIETQRRAYGIQYAGRPGRLAAINQALDVREAALPGPQRTGFMGGWERAGGFGSALGTIAKYGLAYKMIDVPLDALNKTLDMSVNAVKGAAAAWADYEEQMAKTARTMRQPGVAPGFQKQMMGKDALDFISRYRVSMEEAAKAQYELGSAGFSTRETLQTYQVPLKVAIGLQGDITETTRLMTQMLKIHGDQMGKNLTDYEKMVRIGAILARTWEIEQVELSDLAVAYKYVAGTASAMKIPIEQLVPTLGYMATFGLRRSIGGTGLNQFFTQMAKNVTITANQIEGMKKSAQGMEHVLKIKPGTYTIFDLLIETSKAGAKLRVGDIGMIKVARAFSDMFTIRGARPALLLADTQKLADLIKNIGDVSDMTTEKAEKLVQQYVDLMQATPIAQMELMKNKLYVLGVEGFAAAAGHAGELVSGLKGINEWLAKIRPKVVDIGLNINVKVKGATAFLEGLFGGRQPGDKGMKNILGYGDLYRAVEAQQKAERKAWAGTYDAGLSAAVGRTLTQEFKRGESVESMAFAGRAKVQQHMALLRSRLAELLGADQTLRAHPEYLFSTGVMPRKRKAVDRLLSEYKKRNIPLDLTERRLRIEGLSDAIREIKTFANNETALNKWLQKYIDSTIRTGEEERRKLLGGASDIKSTPTGGGAGGHGGGGPWKPEDILGYKISAGQVMGRGAPHFGAHREAGVFDILATEIATHGQTMQEAQMNLSLAGYVVAIRQAKKGMWPAHLHGATPGMAPVETARLMEQGWGKFAGLSIGMPAMDKNAAGRREIYDQFANEYMRYIGNLLTVGNIGPMQALSLLNPIALGQGVFQGRSIDTKADAFNRRKQIWQDIKDKAEQAKKAQEDALALRAGLADFMAGRAAVGYEAKMSQYEAILSRINNTEKLYGETLDTVKSKIAAQTDVRMTAASALEREEARLNSLTNEYNRLMQDTPAEASLLGTKRANPEQAKAMADRLQTVASEMDKSRGDVARWRQEIEGAGVALEELSRRLIDLPIEKMSKGIELRERINRADFRARGGNYELSDERLRDLGRRATLARARIAAAKKRGDLPAILEGGAELREVEGDVLDQLRARQLQTADMGLRMRQTRRGWFRGSPKEMARMQTAGAMDELSMEMQRLRKEFASQPWAQDMLDQYERVMTKEAILRPWLDARDRIEQDWTGMFQNMISEMSTGGNPFRALDAIIQSMQGQIISGMVRKNLGGWFDMLASQETGISTPMAEVSAAATGGANALNLFSTELGTATMTIAGLNQKLTDAFLGDTPGNFLRVRRPERGRFEPLSGAAGGLLVGKSWADYLADKQAGKLGDMLEGKAKKGGGAKKGAPGANPWARALGKYAEGSMVGAWVGQAMGYDPTSAGIAGGAGYALALALGANPVTAVIAGIASIFGFGKKKKSQEDTSPQRDIYGMPAFEYESYLYNLYERQSGWEASGRVTSGTGVYVNRGGNTININVYGGDPSKVEQSVRRVISEQFGPISQLAASSRV